MQKVNISNSKKIKVSTNLNKALKQSILNKNENKSDIMKFIKTDIIKNKNDENSKNHSNSKNAIRSRIYINTCLNPNPQKIKEIDLNCKLNR